MGQGCLVFLVKGKGLRMVITDEYINELFDGTKFGATIDNSADEKRKILAKNLRQQIDGYWSGHTIYHIAVNGGFLIDGKKSSNKKLTLLGHLFLTA